MNWCKLFQVKGCLSNWHFIKRRILGQSSLYSGISLYKELSSFLTTKYKVSKETTQDLLLR